MHVDAVLRCEDSQLAACEKEKANWLTQSRDLNSAFFVRDVARQLGIQTSERRTTFAF